MFGSLTRDMESDPIFGAHTRMMNQMNRMMNSMFGGSAFGGAMGPQMGMLEPFGGMRGHGMGHQDMMPFGGMMSPFGHMGMGIGGFPDFDQLANGSPNGHSFSSMSMTSVTAGPDGRPQVYQASNQTAVAPGGVRETRKSVMDSRSGTKKMAVGRHIGDQGHVREREENVYTGQREENEELINLDEHEAEDFNRSWRQRAYGGGYSHSTSMPAITAGPDQHQHQRRSGGRHQQGRVREIGYPTRTSESTPTVTIEELPPSDDEATPSPPQPAAIAAASSSRRPRSPYVREKKSKSKRAKKN